MVCWCVSRNENTTSKIWEYFKVRSSDNKKLEVILFSIEAELVKLLNCWLKNFTKEVSNIGYISSLHLLTLQ